MNTRFVKISKTHKTLRFSITFFVPFFIDRETENETIFFRFMDCSGGYANFCGNPHEELATKANLSKNIYFSYLLKTIHYLRRKKCITFNANYISIACFYNRNRPLSRLRFTTRKNSASFVSHCLLILIFSSLLPMHVYGLPMIYFANKHSIPILNTALHVYARIYEELFHHCKLNYSTHLHN